MQNGIHTLKARITSNGEGLEKVCRNENRKIRTRMIVFYMVRVFNMPIDETASIQNVVSYTDASKFLSRCPNKPQSF